MHDASRRLQVFVDSANAAEADFSIQLGDFCMPKRENRSFSDIWKTLERSGYHVLGNHDMDGGCTREQNVSYLSMTGRYYSFDMKGWHFVVLDGNDPLNQADQGYPHTVTDPLNPPELGYQCNIAEDQLMWLRADLEATKLPVVVFVHQSPELSLLSGERVRTLFETTNAHAGWQKVLACFNGHDHIDHEVNINGIWYIHINSMSCYWLGEEYICERYTKEIDKQFPLIKYTAPYKDPLYAMVTLEVGGKISIDGVRSDWVGSSPREMGHRGKHVSPCIVSRILHHPE